MLKLKAPAEFVGRIDGCSKNWFEMLIEGVVALVFIAPDNSFDWGGIVRSTGRTEEPEKFLMKDKTSKLL